MLELTRGQIITQGLSKAARPDLASEARLWLNLFLEEQYYNHDWEWLVKDLPGVTIVNGLDAPDDYRAMKNATYTDSSGNIRELIIVSNAAEWDSIRRNFVNTSNSTPTHAYIDSDTKKFYFAPNPTSSLSMNLKYYYIPDIPIHTLAANDLESVKWDLPKMILVDHIKTMAMEYNDDQRQFENMKMGDKKLTEAKMNAHDRRGGRSRIPLGKSFRRRFGSRRNGDWER